MTDNSSPHTGKTPAGNPRADAIPQWLWRPGDPITFSPLFSFPPRPTAVLSWFARAWLPFTELTLYLLLGIAVWHWLQPPLSETGLPAVEWIAPVWLRNLLLHTTLATLLHLWLYTWRGQGDAFRFRHKAPTALSSLFLGGSQLRDNVFWTLASGVTIWTLYESLMWMALARGMAPTITLAGNPIWFVLWFPLIGVWYSFHFYWVHRFLHWKPMYTRYHAVHHRNVVTGPWSGFSMHPVEHLLYLSSVFIHLIVPSHPVHMLFHLYWLTLATATSHSGYESLLIGNHRSTISTFFHQLHHRHFNCNYGNVELPLDKWFGSFNDGTGKTTTRRTS